MVGTPGRLVLRWVQDALKERTDFLLSYFNESLASEPTELLGRIGSKATAALQSPGFSRNVAGKAQLTNEGYALAADLGLLVARLLLATGSGTGSWSVLRRPRADAFYNHPVLEGFGSVPLEPVGGSIAEAYAVLSGDRDANAWRRMVEYWRASESAVKPPSQVE